MIWKLHTKATGAATPQTQQKIANFESNKSHCRRSTTWKDNEESFRATYSIDSNTTFKTWS